MIDLNADLGEGFGDDATMLKIVTSASIACGGHAGDAETMRETICGARANGVRIPASAIVSISGADASIWPLRRSVRRFSIRLRSLMLSARRKASVLAI